MPRLPLRPPALRTLAATGAAVLLLSACHHPAPAPSRAPLPPALESLRAPEYAPGFGLGFWTGRLDAQATDPTWRQALAFCGGADLSRYPNCRTVRLLATASRIPGFSTSAASAAPAASAASAAPAASTAGASTTRHPARALRAEAIP